MDLKVTQLCDVKDICSARPDILAFRMASVWREVCQSDTLVKFWWHWLK